MPERGVNVLFKFGTGAANLTISDLGRRREVIKTFLLFFLTNFKKEGGCYFFV